LTTEIVSKEPSEELKNMIEVWSEGYLNSKDLAAKILEKSETEGFSKEETRSLIESVLKEKGLQKRQILRIIPDELKDQSKTKLSLRNSNDDMMSSSPKDKKVSELEGEIEELKFKLEQKDEQLGQSNTANRELMNQIDKDKKAKTIIDNVKKTGFLDTKNLVFPEETHLINDLIRHNITYMELPRIVSPFLGPGNTKFHIWIQKVRGQ
jgi:hypothetical protein